jgi:hypothetical protein
MKKRRRELTQAALEQLQERIRTNQILPEDYELAEQLLGEEIAELKEQEARQTPPRGKARRKWKREQGGEKDE